MEKVIKVEGMVCTGCENRLKNALKLIDKVEDVKASHEENTVTITSKKEIDLKTIYEKIEDLGFTVKEN